MWKRFVIRIAFDLVCQVVVEWAKRQGKPWAMDLEEFCHSIKSKL